jgi:hypothetical protein
MNDLMRLKREKRMTYEAISALIEKRTGRRYNAGYLGNVARGEVELADGLRLHLFDAFRDETLLPSAQSSVNSHIGVSA